MACFCGFRGVFDSVSGVRVFVKCFIPAKPDGAGKLVDRREGDVDAVVSSCHVRLSIVDRFEGREAEPRDCEESANEVLPSNLLLMSDGF